MRIRVVAVLSALLMFVPALAGAKVSKSELKSKAKEVQKVLGDLSFTALVGLHVHGFHYVRPDGSPIEDKKQSKRKGSKGIGTKDFAVAEGEVGLNIGLGVKNTETLTVMLSKKGGMAGAWNPSNVVIQFDRPMTVDEISVEAIARALSSLILIEGFEPGEVLEDVLAEIDEAAASIPSVEEAPSAPPVPIGPTVERLTIRATPARVTAGGQVELTLEYEVFAPHGEVIVKESFLLEVGGKALPSYPIEESIQRGDGMFTGSFAQPIPSGASAGAYTFRGEVCVQGDCISRSVTFEVVR